MDRDIHVLGLGSGELRPDNQILVLLYHVDGRGLTGHLCSLLVPCSPGYATEHLVEQTVHLAQRVVEPAAPLSAHHGLYPLLSLSPATRGGKHRACLYRLRRPMLNLLPYQISPSSAEPYWTRRGVCISDWCSDRRRYRRPRPVGRAPDRQERVRWRCLQAGTLPPG
jgi:hypothetical protein